MSITATRLPLLLLSAIMTAVCAPARTLHDYAIPTGGTVHSTRCADVVQYVPLATPWVLKACGATTSSSWDRMAVSQGVSAMIMAGSVYALKNSVSSLRPDGSDRHSFPSGHAAWAFTGATMTARETGESAPLYAMGAYTIAAAVSAERVVSKRHYPTDVVAGAAIGIISTQLGYLVGDLFFKKSGSVNSGRHELSADGDGRGELSVSTALAFDCGDIRVGEISIERLPSLMTSVGAGLRLSGHLALNATASLLSTPLTAHTGNESVYLGNLNSVGTALSVAYIRSLGKRADLRAATGAGYRFTLDRTPCGSALTTSGGTPTGHITAGCDMRLYSNLTAGVTIGYELSGYNITVAPSEACRISAAGSTRGTGHSIMISLSTRYNF